MTTSTLTLAEFLLARINEDEAVAQAVQPPFLGLDTFASRFLTAESDHDQTDSDFVDTFDPARVLAECEAKRAAIEAAWTDHERIEGEWGMCRNRGQMEAGDDYPAVVTAPAQPYASHPDFRDEWRA